METLDRHGQQLDESQLIGSGIPRTLAGLLAAGSLCIASAATLSVAQTYPPGLSDAAKAKFATYDARMTAAIRESKSRQLSPVEMVEVFHREYGLAIIRDIFGSDWAAIREYADAALAALPVVDESARFSAPPSDRFDMKEGEGLLGESLAKMRPFEEGLATARLWDPLRVANAASMMVLGRTTPEEVAHHSVTSSYTSQQLARTTWQGRDALVFYSGAWVFVMNYIRTAGGLIWATEIGLYPR